MELKFAKTFFMTLCLLEIYSLQVFQLTVNNVDDVQNKQANERKSVLNSKTFLTSSENTKQVPSLSLKMLHVFPNFNSRRRKFGATEPAERIKKHIIDVGKCPSDRIKFLNRCLTPEM